MKYSLSSRQPMSELKKVDEVRVEYKDRAIIADYINELTTQRIILKISRGDIVEIDDYKTLSEALDLHLCVEDFNMIEALVKEGFAVCWAFPVGTYAELRSLVSLGVSLITLQAPLSFELPKVKAITGNIPLRLVANYGIESNLPGISVLRSQWIRPEGLAAYNEYIDTIEFRVDDLQKERTMNHIYRDNGYWPGNLRLLLPVVDTDVDNRAIPTDLDEKRTRCGQHCLENGICSYCDNAFYFAKAIENLRAARDQKDDN